jgi:hypothetical protein
LAFSYWIDKPRFLTEGKFAAVLITPSLGVPNWSVIYIKHFTAIKAEKKKFEGSKPTTRMRRRRCWPKRNNLRDQNPQLEWKDDAAGPWGII